MQIPQSCLQHVPLPSEAAETHAPSEKPRKSWSSGGGDLEKAEGRRDGDKPGLFPRERVLCCRHRHSALRRIAP